MSSKSARRSTDYRRKKRRFYGNQHSKDKTLEPVAIDVTSASSKKLCLKICSYQSNSNERGESQNSNESFNSTVWKYCPKTPGSSKKVVDVAMNEAVVMYNYGMAGRLDIMKHLGCKLGHFSFTYVFQFDNARIKEAEMKSKSSTLDARRALRIQNKPCMSILLK
ncbi:uncharacterized protein TNCV_3674221 [Trichonephila clavipes]|nr:uncharacterized protein TNCV_3674221 [Trichonephila clavipes]